MTRALHRVLTLLALALAVCSGGARAEDALPLTSLRGGVNAAAYASSFRDPSRMLALDQVAARAHAFVPLDGEPTRGFDRAALWIHVAARNDGDTPRAWYLDLGYPHLDFVTLYVVHADGRVDKRETGDMLEFSRRDLDDPNFVFRLVNAPHERTDIYLRVATTGTLRTPLVAWEPDEYAARQRSVLALFWAFAGALLVMALFNVAVFALIRQVEFLTQAALLVFLCGVLASFHGLTFQLLIPDHPLLANRAIGVSLTLTMTMGSLTCALVTWRAYLGSGDRAVLPFVRVFRIAALVAAALCAVSLAAPKEFATRVSVIAPLAYLLGGVGLLFSGEWKRQAQLRLFSLSWGCVLVLGPLAFLANQGILPNFWLFSWAGHVGCALQGVFTSLALASRVKTLGDHAAALNAQLSSNVDRLQHALARAEEANEAAQRATRAKDEFMATMSHELRTPLNAIINVPQGLLEDFVDQRTAHCTGCAGAFVLEEGDRLGLDVACPDCQRRGALVEGAGITYVGDPAHTARFLRKIERSGQHLLQLVDGVLDFSKLEAGRFELSWSELDLAALIRDVVDVMSEPAQRKGLAIEVEIAHSALPRRGDPLRVKQVLLNLLSNAIKFSEAGGRICIRVKREGETDILTVKDQGIGIAAEHHERIFAGFEQVHKGDKRKYGGTGLGLPISRALVRMHGGELWVESTLGHGAAFIVRLPPVDAASVPQ